MNKYMHLIYSKEYMKTYENGFVRNKINPKSKAWKHIWCLSCFVCTVSL